MADNRKISLFGVYAENMQVLLDSRQDKFKTKFFTGYFDFNLPQMGLTYASAIGRSRIEAAASIVNHGAQAPLRSRPELEKLTGEIAAIKVKRALNEKQLRDYLTIQTMKVSDETKKISALKLIWDDASYCREAVLDRLDIMICDGLSTGKITLSNVTNPDGIITTDIDLLMPTANINKVAVVWSIANAATMTPIKDIRDAITSGEERGIQGAKIMIPKALFYALANCTEVTNLLKGFFRISTGGTMRPTFDQVNEYMTANLLPVFEIVDVVKAIEKDGVISTYRPWKAENIAIVPDGKLGSIHNAIAIESISPVEGSTYATANNVLISKWHQTEPYGEFTRGELSAFPGIDAIDSILIIKTDTAA